MNNKIFTIFVVDDDALLRTITVDQLQGRDYQIYEFDNGEDCLAALDKQPNLILLDVEMPGKSGLEICKEIRDEGLDDIQIIFVSAHDDLETLMSGFRVGANDFVVKNTDQEILLNKVELALQSEASKQRLKAQLSDAQQAAFTAMFSLGETGIVMQFFRSCFHCDSLTQLANLLGETLAQFSLNGLTRLSGDFETVDFSSVSEGSTPLEQSILSYAAKLGRVHQNGQRLVLNYPNVTLLLTDLDLEDDDLIGRLRDHWALIAEATSIRVDVINIKQKQLHDMQIRIESAGYLAEDLAAIEMQIYATNSQLEVFIEQFHCTIEQLMVSLHLTDTQENSLRDMIDQLFERFKGHFENHSLLLRGLTKILDRQKQLLDTHS